MTSPFTLILLVASLTFGVTDEDTIAYVSLVAATVNEVLRAWASRPA